MIRHVKEGHECKLLLRVVAGAGIGLAVGMSGLVSVGLSYLVIMHLKNALFARTLSCPKGVHEWTGGVWRPLDAVSMTPLNL